MPAYCNKYSHEDGSTERAAALRTAWEYATEPTGEFADAWQRYIASNTLDASERDLRHVDRIRDVTTR